MAEVCSLILDKVDRIENSVEDIKAATSENTADLKYHIKRTNDLQQIVTDLHSIVTPIHEKFIADKAIEDYRKKQREDLVYKLKLPGYILAALTAVGAIVAWLGMK